MKIESVVWLRDIVDKLAFKHRVETDEVEQVLNGRPKFRFVEKGERKDEDVYIALGQTNTGRYLSLAFYLQENERGVNIERKRYGEKGEKTI